jgi:hypothetical protein
VRGTIAWPPEAGNLGLGVSIISYDGELTIGILGDKHLVPAPGELLAGITTELDALLDTGPPSPGPAAPAPITGSPSRHPEPRP